jgi:hypothetical protein
MGFVLTPDEAQALIAKDKRNKDVLFPYLNGEDLNSQPNQSPSRWVVNFQNWPLKRGAKGKWKTADEDQRKEWLRTGVVTEDYPDPVAADYPDCLALLARTVKEERATKASDVAAAPWWQFWRRRGELYATIAGMGQVLVRSQVSKTQQAEFVPSDIVYDQRLVVCALETFSEFCIVNCSFHYWWCIFYGSTLRTDATYTPTTCFEPFPFPEVLDRLEDIGRRYYQHRQSVMQSRQEGLTQTYNRFHDPEETSTDIIHLRELHVEMDKAVASAYGWTELNLGHNFHETKQGPRFTISESARREVLDRLLRLNHERYEEEVGQGLHEKGAKPKGKSTQKKRGVTIVSPSLPLFPGELADE